MCGALEELVNEGVQRGRQEGRIEGNKPYYHSYCGHCRNRYRSCGNCDNHEQEVKRSL